MNRYKVLDEFGLAIRTFPSRAEAKRFLQEGWSLVIIPRRDNYQYALLLVGKAPL